MIVPVTSDAAMENSQVIQWWWSL